MKSLSGWIARLGPNPQRNDPAPQAQPYGARSIGGRLRASIRTRVRERATPPWLLATSYTVLFAILAFQWLSEAHETLPREFWMSDSILVVRVLAWINHALLVSPTSIFDAPMNFPAPAQLTGSEHFGSSQLVFAPSFWATGNAVFAANAVALISYPLAAFAMQRLLVVLGCATGAAFVGGLLFALGPLRVPGNLHMIQYLNVWLPVVVLGLVRLRERPTTGRAFVVSLVLTLGFLSSYYMAVMVGLTLAVWAVDELVREKTQRGRLTALLVAAVAAASLVLIATSLPYLQRSTAPDRLAVIAAEEQKSAARAELGFWDGTMAPLMASTGVSVGCHPWLGSVPLFFMALGLLGLRPANRSAGRRTAQLGLIFTTIGGVLALGPAVRLGDHFVPLPYAALVNSSLHFFRVPERFVVLGGFGSALMAGAGMDVLVRAGGSFRMRALAVSAALFLVVWGEGLALSDTPLVGIGAASDDAPVYEEVGRLARSLGGGPLLEIPAMTTGAAPTAVTIEALIGSTRHGLPTIMEYTGYLPAHLPLVEQTVRRLPDGNALADLVDMTHLRWLLIRPSRDWPRLGDRTAFLNRLGAYPGALGRRWQVRRFLLVEVGLKPRRPQWFRALAAGPIEGRSLLGTPFAPGVAPAARSRILVANPPVRAGVLNSVALDLTISNLGESDWPVFLLPPQAGEAEFLRAVRLRSLEGGLMATSPIPIAQPPPTAVQLVARWWPATGQEGPPAKQQSLQLNRDVPAGESLRQSVVLFTPDSPGLYDLEIDAEQVDGSPFTGPGSSSLRWPVMVTPATPHARGLT